MFFYKSVLETTFADSLSDMAQPCDLDCRVMKWRSAWPVFHNSVYCFISWRPLCVSDTERLYNGTQLTVEKFPPVVGLKPRTARSADQGLTHWATEAFCSILPTTVKILKFGTPQTIAIIVLKIEKVWCNIALMHPKDADGMANSVDPDQTAS